MAVQCKACSTGTEQAEDLAEAVSALAFVWSSHSLLLSLFSLIALIIRCVRRSAVKRGVLVCSKLFFWRCTALRGYQCQSIIDLPLIQYEEMGRRGSCSYLVCSPTYLSEHMRVSVNRETFGTTAGAECTQGKAKVWKRKLQSAVKKRPIMSRSLQRLCP